MQITKKSLQKFKAMYKKRFNKELSDKETLRKAEKLLQIYVAVYGISGRSTGVEELSNK
jgi:predicted metal-dependent hydrolase